MTWVATGTFLTTYGAAIAGGAAVAASAYASYTQAKTDKAIAENNAEVADINAASAKRQGELDAQKVRRQGSQLEGTQRAALAARGLDLGDGTASDLVEQTDFFSQVDQATARDNAAKNAWAIQRGGSVEAFKAGSISPGFQAGSTLLSGAASVSSKWYTPRTTPETSYSISGSAARR